VITVAVLLVVAGGVLLGVVGWRHGTSPPVTQGPPDGKVANPFEGKQGAPGPVAAPVAVEPDAQPKTPGRTPPASAEPLDPFKAFLNASKNGKVPAGAAQSPPTATPAVDPFKAVAEESKKRSEAATKSPFGR
jgi:hypothetical protein